MNRGLFFVAVGCLSLTLSLPSQSQVSFFQPPTYSGSGAPFVYDFNGDGKPDILTGLDGTMNLGNGDGTFTPGTPVSGVTSSNPILAVGDFNGDGKWDLMEQGLGTLDVLLGNGDGTFQAPISTASGASLSSIVVTSLRGNSVYDVIGVFNNSLLVYLSKGDGTFVSAASYSLGTVASDATIIVSVGDFNGDQKQDLVVSAGDSVSTQEMTFLGNGDGTLSTTPVASAGAAGAPTSVAVADFTGDGKLDLVVANEGAQTPVNILVGLGNGGFTLQTTSVPYGSLAATDLRGIGKQDLVVSATFGLYVYLGNGDGTFFDASNYVTGGNVIADMNLDGKKDLIGNGVLLLGNGDGTFQGIPFGLVNPAPTNAEAPGAAIVLGNFENNGVNDAAALATSDVPPSTVYILHNDGTGLLSLTQTYTLPNTAAYDISNPMVTADLRGNGNLDLIVGGNSGYSVLLGNGDGTFQSPLDSNIGGVSFVTVADVNNDHKPDLILQSWSGNYGVPGQTLMVLLGNGDGSFQSPVSYFDAGVGTLLLSDFNGDGKLDIVAGNGILYGNGDGTFQDIVFPATLNNVAAALTGDFNGDKKADLLVWGASGSQVALGNGDGTFDLLPPSSWSCIRPSGIADFNGDGIVDIVGDLGCSANSSGTEIALGNGDGTFGSPIKVQAPGGLLYLMAVADMNGDGLPDIVVPYPDSPFQIPTGLGVLLNTTLAGPPQPDFRVIASGLSPSSVTAGSSATSTVTITPLNGFNGSVALSCSGMPSGVNCAFNPASISGGNGTSTLTLSTTSSTAAGSYSFTVNGTSASLTRVGALNLTVAPETPDFGIGPGSGSSTSQTISAGQTASFTLAFAPVSSFNGTINLSCAVTPVVSPAPTCSMSSSSVQMNGSATQTVTLSVGTTAPVTTGIGWHRGLPPVGRPMGWTFLFLVCAGILAGTRKRRFALATPAALFLMLSMSCGGSGSSGSQTTPGTPAGTYTATVTAASGNLSHTMALQVVVH